MYSSAAFSIFTQFCDITTVSKTLSSSPKRNSSCFLPHSASGNHHSPTFCLCGFTCFCFLLINAYLHGMSFSFLYLQPIYHYIWSKVLITAYNLFYKFQSCNYCVFGPSTFNVIIGKLGLKCAIFVHLFSGIIFVFYPLPSSGLLDYFFLEFHLHLSIVFFSVSFCIAL